MTPRFIDEATFAEKKVGGPTSCLTTYDGDATAALLPAAHSQPRKCGAGSLLL